MLRLVCVRRLLAVLESMVFRWESIARPDALGYYTRVPGMYLAGILAV